MLLAISLIKSKIKINSINTKRIPIEIPLIKTQELKPGWSLKTSKKINQMLKELTKIKTEKGESTNINFLHKKDKVNVETCYSNSETMMKRLINIHIHQNYLPIKKKKKNPKAMVCRRNLSKLQGYFLSSKENISGESEISNLSKFPSNSISNLSPINTNSSLDIFLSL